MKGNTKNKPVASQLQRTKLFGVQDGVAGSWIAPNYLETKQIEYVADNKQHFENVTRQLRHSVEAYKQELKTSHG